MESKFVNWYVTSLLNRQNWYPYIYEGEIYMHAEGADTDMGDVTMDELVSIMGPVVVRKRAET